MRRVLVLVATAEDLETGAAFYERQEVGVGNYFKDSLIADIVSLGIIHEIHPVHFACHRMLASRFPFGIYYRETDSQTQVVAVLDLRRDPSWIRRELTKRGK